MATSRARWVGTRSTRKKHDPKKKARRRVMEACHGWFNRFRKPLVRYEKLEHTFRPSQVGWSNACSDAREQRLSPLP